MAKIKCNLDENFEIEEKLAGTHYLVHHGIMWRDSVTGEDNEPKKTQHYHIDDFESAKKHKVHTSKNYVFNPVHDPVKYNADKKAEAEAAKKADTKTTKK